MEYSRQKLCKEFSEHDQGFVKQRTISFEWANRKYEEIREMIENSKYKQVLTELRKQKEDCRRQQSKVKRLTEENEKLEIFSRNQTRKLQKLSMEVVKLTEQCKKDQQIIEGNNMLIKAQQAEISQLQELIKSQRAKIEQVTNELEQTKKQTDKIICTKEREIWLLEEKLNFVEATKDEGSER